MTSPAPSLQDRFLGCILGQAVGDALGAPFEGLPADTIYRDFGGASKLIASPPVDELFYTDDTQMMIGVSECLLEKGCIDPDRLLQIFERNYQPSRCYGPGTQRLFDGMRAGKETSEIIRAVFPGGSLGNGAAMRVAPIGLVFHRDPVWLEEEAKLSAQVTHLHPIGIDAAVIFARAVGLVSACDRFDRRAFYSSLLQVAKTEEFQWQLSTAAKLEPDASITFGNSLEAHRSVTSALMCFTSSPDSYEDAICRAIGLGNDTDTLAGIAGALSGAYLGIEAIPPRLVKMLEQGPRGRDYLEEISLKLYSLSLAARADGS